MTRAEGAPRLKDRLFRLAPACQDARDTAARNHPMKLAIAAGALIVALPAIAQQGLPSPVTAAMKEAGEACSPSKMTFEAGFISRRDINADGIADFVLDYGKSRCGENGRIFCGSAGCLTQVFASLDGRYVKVLDENVRDVQFRRVKDRPAMILDLHGSACGRYGAAACGTTLYWNGSKFSAAN